MTATPTHDFTVAVDTNYSYDYTRGWTIAEHALHLSDTLRVSLECSLAVVRHYVRCGVIVPLTPDETEAVVNAEHHSVPDDYEPAVCPVCETDANHSHAECLAELVDDVYPDPEDRYPGAI